jgi:hypothetical protein
MSTVLGIDIGSPGAIAIVTCLASTMGPLGAAPSTALCSRGSTRNPS